MVLLHQTIRRTGHLNRKTGIFFFFSIESRRKQVLDLGIVSIRCKNSTLLDIVETNPAETAMHCLLVCLLIHVFLTTCAVIAKNENNIFKQSINY